MTNRVELVVAEQDLRRLADARVKVRDGLDAWRAVSSERDSGSKAVSVRLRSVCVPPQAWEKLETAADDRNSRAKRHIWLLLLDVVPARAFSESL